MMENIMKLADRKVNNYDISEWMAASIPEDNHLRSYSNGFHLLPAAHH